MPREAHEPPLTPEQEALVTAYFRCAIKASRKWATTYLFGRDDCEQHAERALMKAARGYDPTRGPFLTWLRSTMDLEFRGWRFIEYRKLRNRTPTGSIDTDPVDRRRDDRDLVDIADSAAKARAMIQCLPERERTAILMRADDGTYAEIGERIGCTKEWASRIVEKARAKLEEMERAA